MACRRFSYGFLVAGLLLTLVAFGQRVHARPYPELGLSEVTFDFGFMPQDVFVTHVFWVKNVGGDTMHIKDIKTRCGCTRAPLLTHVLAVGDSTPVELTFESGKYSGSINKSAAIVSDAVGRVPRLGITAYVAVNPDSLRLIVVDPPAIDLDRNRPEYQPNPWVYPITMRNVSGQPLRVRLIERPPVEFVEVNLPSGTIESGEEKSFSIRIHPAIADTLLRRSVTIEFDDADHTRYTIAITKARRWGPTTQAKM